MTPKNLLVPIDFSACAEHALDYACGLAEKLGATIHLVTAIGAGVTELSVALADSMVETMRANSVTQLQAMAKARAPLSTFGSVLVEPGDARDVILHAADTLNTDLIVMGSHGRRGLSRMFLGSVAEAVLRRAPCPVLVVRMPKENHP